MVWTDYDARALLPAGMQVGTASIPFAVDGVARPGTQAWSVYASNIDRDGRTAPWGGTLWFVLNGADVVSHGRVSVDLSAVLSAAGRLLHDNYGWPELGQHYWLDTASFGVEFGPASGESDGLGPVALLRADLGLLPRRAEHAAGRRLRHSCGVRQGLSRGDDERGGARERPRAVLGEGADAQPGEGVRQSGRLPWRGRTG